MKNLITTIAALILFSMCFMQFTAQEITHEKIRMCENTIDEFAAQYGAGKDISLLRQKLSEVLKCSAEEITAQEVINDTYEEYTVTYPLYNVLGPAKMLGVSEEKNKVLHKTQATVIKQGINP